MGHVTKLSWPASRQWSRICKDGLRKIVTSSWQLNSWFSLLRIFSVDHSLGTREGRHSYSYITKGEGICLLYLIKSWAMKPSWGIEIYLGLRLTLVLDVMSGHFHAPTALTPSQKPPQSFDGRLGGPRLQMCTFWRRSLMKRNSSVTQDVTSRHTDDWKFVVKWFEPVHDYILWWASEWVVLFWVVGLLSRVIAVCAPESRYGGFEHSCQVDWANSTASMLPPWTRADMTNMANGK
jgi:hypothetical protein